MHDAFLDLLAALVPPERLLMLTEDVCVPRRAVPAMHPLIVAPIGDDAAKAPRWHGDRGTRRGAAVPA